MKKGEVGLWADYGLPADDTLLDAIPGAPWWLCRSRRSLSQLLVAMRRQEVAVAIYDQIGAILPMGKTPEGEWLLVLQMLRRNRSESWAIDLALSDAGIMVDEPWEGDE